jgi:enoyl-CoA hydratase/carnithine racemase
MRHVGERMARWLLLTGELIDAQTAERAGFVNAVSDDLMPTALAWARSLAEGGPLALRLGELLTPAEVGATRARVEDLLASGRHPEPSGEWPAIPWPPV